jgi:hypothetical protein
VGAGVHGYEWTGSALAGSVEPAAFAFGGFEVIGGDPALPAFVVEREFTVGGEPTDVVAGVVEDDGALVEPSV